MTWEELVEFAKQYGLVVDGLFSTDEYQILTKGTTEIWFCQDGSVELYQSTFPNRTYEQMKAIIENLFDKV